MRESYSDREDRERERDRDRGRDRERERERDRDREIQRDREQREGNIKHEGEDGMPSTSDFVKKLYKCVALSPCIIISSDCALGCWRTRLSSLWSHGAPTATALSSKT